MRARNSGNGSYHISYDTIAKSRSRSSSSSVGSSATSIRRLHAADGTFAAAVGRHVVCFQLDKQLVETQQQDRKQNWKACK